MNFPKFCPLCVEEIEPTYDGFMAHIHSEGHNRHFGVAM
jgi:hypothetical protein